MNEMKLKTVIAGVLRINVDEVTDEASMDTFPEWDSLSHMNIVIALEEEFNISIPDEDAANMSSVLLIKIVLEELI
jgi:acyl carrier protein